MLAATAGATIGVQVRVNAELGLRVGSAIVATAVSFAGGLLVAACVLCLSRGARAGMRRLRRVPVPWWTYLGGAGGAAFMTVAVIATPILGVAMVSIAAVAGQLGGALATDHAGLPGVRRAVTPVRLAGAAIALLAVAVSRANGGVMTMGPLGTTGLVVAAGGGIAVQSALNARLRTATSPAVATTINYAVGLAIMVVAVFGVALESATDIATWPSSPLLYVGGALGAGIIAATAVAAAAIGVLRATLAVIGGQLAGAVLLDALLPAGPGPGVALLAGAALTILAAAVVGSASAAGARRPASSAA